MFITSNTADTQYPEYESNLKPMQLFRCQSVIEFIEVEYGHNWRHLEAQVFQSTNSNLVKHWKDGKNRISEKHLQRLLSQYDDLHVFYNSPLFTFLEDYLPDAKRIQRLLRQHYSIKEGVHHWTLPSYPDDIPFHGFISLMKIGDLTSFMIMLGLVRYYEFHQLNPQHQMAMGCVYRTFPAIARMKCFYPNWKKMGRLLETIAGRVDLTACTLIVDWEMMEEYIEAEHFDPGIFGDEIFNPLSTIDPVKILAKTDEDYKSSLWYQLLPSATPSSNYQLKLFDTA